MRKQVVEQIQFCNFIVSRLSGFFLGVLLAYSISDPFPSLMCGDICVPVTIVGLLVSVFLPLLFSSLFLVIYKPFLFLLVCFLKAISVGYTAMLVCFQFLHGGWLVRVLLLYSDFVILAVFLWQWLRMFNRDTDAVWKNTYICLMSICAVIGIDYFIISPLLRGLF